MSTDRPASAGRTTHLGLPERRTAPSADDSRRVHRSSRRYRRTFLGVVLALTAMVAALGVAGAVRGPALDSARIPLDTATELPGQRLLLEADQALAQVDVSDVSVSPSAEVEVAQQGSVLTLTFAEPLRYDTRYRVSVRTAGAATGAASVIEHEFTTPEARLLALVRDPADADRIVERSPGDSAMTTLVAAERIQEYARTPSGVAVAELDAADNSLLSFVADGADAAQQIPLPDAGDISRLASSGRTSLIGFVFSSDRPFDDPQAIRSRLLVFDPSDARGVPRPVLGLDGEPLSVMDWTWVPGTTSLVAQTFDQSMLLIDVARPAEESAPVPLGQHAELRGFLPGSSSLIVADPEQGSVIDLRSGESSVLELPPSGFEGIAYAGALVVLGQDSYVEVVSHPDPDGVGRPAFEVLAVDRDGVRTLFTPPEGGGAIRALCATANGQYVAVEVESLTGQPDFYPNRPSTTGTTTYIVDTATGELEGSVAGFAVSWC